MTAAAPAPCDDLVVLAMAGEAMAAEAARAAAQRRFLVAPHGERQRRLTALREATDAALKAELAVTLARREAGL
ncbi:MAG: hypothetical protein Q8K93_17575 [Reyranella sp.]|uniref:hypothetical protein n=1 Tax=Reyranella sp. TaxID=1929291 RepID=UPI00272F6F4A|nr:hypothetical protein [Reyranella sp.]MDP1964001.1 hypothetical protein [Reyranella sp.]MDP2376552.1 hypothetical protein [Reyranella sp.]